MSEEPTRTDHNPIAEQTLVGQEVERPTEKLDPIGPIGDQRNYPPEIKKMLASDYSPGGGFDDGLREEPPLTPQVADYTDLDTGILKAISTAKMMASLRVAGEAVDPEATEKTLEQIQALRLALKGLGLVGQHFNAVGQPVSDQVAIVLSSDEVETLIMRLTGRVRFGTILG